MQFFPYGVDGGKHYKLSELATVEKGQIAATDSQRGISNIVFVCNMSIIGSYEQGNKIQKRDLEEFNKLLPMGYTG